LKGESELKEEGEGGVVSQGGWPWRRGVGVRGLMWGIWGGRWSERGVVVKGRDWVVFVGVGGGGNGGGVDVGEGGRDRLRGAGEGKAGERQSKTRKKRTDSGPALYLERKLDYGKELSAPRINP